MVGYLAEAQPVVDGVGWDTELGGGLLDFDLAVLDGDGARPEDLGGVADPATPPAVNGLPLPVTRPATLSMSASSALVCVAPWRRITSNAASEVRPGPGRTTVSSSVAPVCQRTPIRMVFVSGSGSSATSATSERSRVRRVPRLTSRVGHRFRWSDAAREVSADA
ncbi:hypothetical protein ACN27G_19635 [Plantactinospora sp. WMMB334]|uniref:hypothetical protein n=1 Tax=Plantactinospora sp. WMMB334 TaxID=3404119 RepID=UPI003B93D6AB